MGHVGVSVVTDCYRPLTVTNPSQLLSITSHTMQQYFIHTAVEDWSRSDIYHNSFLIQKDDALDKAIQHSAAQGLPDIAVTPAQGKFLNLLALSIGAQRILEIGTLGG